MSGTSIADRAPWLADAGLQRLLVALSAEGEEARIAGGAVRNALLGQPVADIDIATTNLPEETIARAEKAGFRPVPTGKEHGTITVVVGGKGYEVTTLRQDVETDGRRARVVFGKDWKRDAERRDFTINALYAGADGEVIDLVGGLADLESRTLRFIGDASQRIREDYLRILRFFRFFAWYGAGRPDPDGIRACARLKDGLSHLSAERIWAETRKLLAAPDPARALLWMRQTGVLTAMLPETEKWGIDAIPGLVAAERDLGWPVDAMLRLMAILPPDAPRLAALAERLRLSKADAERLSTWAGSPLPAADMSELAFSKLLYRSSPGGIGDRLRLALAQARANAATSDKPMIEAGGYSRLLKFLKDWKRPVLPVSGKDLAALGFAPGKPLGDALRRIEEAWVAGGFAESRDALLERAASLPRL